MDFLIPIPSSTVAFIIFLLLLFLIF
jgi:hypothetical protein